MTAECGDSLNSICWNGTPFPWRLQPNLVQGKKPKGVEECVCYQRSCSVGSNGFILN